MIRGKIVVPFLFIIILVWSIPAIARFEEVVRGVDQFFASTRGVVVSVDGDNVVVDLDKQKGSYVGKEFKIYKEGVEIKHPITGAVLGKRRYYAGMIKITEVYDKYSVANIIEKKGEITPGDLVTVSLPIKVNINLKNFDKRLELLLREDMTKSQSVAVTKEKSDTLINFSQDDKGGVSADIIIGGTFVKNLYFADINFAEGRSTTSDILKSKPLDYEFRTMAVGKPRQDDYDYIAVAERRYVHFYRFTGKDFEYVGKIDKKFDEVISVEMADLNDNGIEEVFVTSIDDSLYPITYIYEFDGKNFKLIKDNLPFITRSVHENGAKKIVTQRISRDGAYVGTINYLIYNNGSYERGDAIPDSVGMAIYGFGDADVDSDRIRENFQIGSDNKLYVYKNGKLLLESNDYFGETPYEFVLKDEVKTTKPGDQIGSMLRRSDSAEAVVSYMENKKKLMGRVFITSDKTIFLVKNNQLTRTLPNIQVYQNASIAGYMLRDRLLRKVWESDNFDPIIADYYLVERYSKKYMYLLRVDRGGLLKGVYSEIYYIEIK
jgi:hypothetical protein